MIKHFRDEFVHHVEHKTCMVPGYAHGLRRDRSARP